jgi:hypothetical protein
MAESTEREVVGVNPIKAMGGWCLMFSACFAPQERFDDFVAAKKNLAAEAGTDDGDGDGPGNDEPVTAEQITGTYLFAISTPVDPVHPLVYLAEFDAAAGMGDALDVRLRQRPLSIRDRKTPVGEFSEWISTSVEPTGVYESPPIDTVVPPAANSFGLALTTTIRFKGTFHNPATPAMPEAKIEFFCGTATGNVEGLNLSLDGTNFAASRLADPEDTSTYPDVVINCDKDPAAPL